MESMTGFSTVQGEKGISWTWILRSVNGKSLDVRTRLPQGYDLLEQNIRETMKQTFSRGNVTASLDVTIDETSALNYKINETFLQRLCHLSLELKEKYPLLQPASIDGLMNVRGVIENIQEEKTRPEETDWAMFASFNDAVKKLKEARQAEGEKIAVFLKDQLAQIEKLAEDAKALASTQPEKVKECLIRQIDALKDNPNIPEERFMQEVSMCMIRADVREELDRLTAHIKTAKELFETEGPVGKRLDFLCQELNRETNTICSKSSDIELTRIGMSLKTVIDQFREQVQNIE